MKKLILAALLLCAYPVVAQKDYYSFAAGIRAGVKSGVTLKGFVTDNFAFEGIAGYWNKSFDGTVLAEYHFHPFRRENISWYLGAGGHISEDAGHDNWVNERTGVDYQDGQMAYGGDLVAGFEFKFPVIPVAVSFDLKPFIEYSSQGGHVTALDAGVGIKCAF